MRESEVAMFRNKGWPPGAALQGDEVPRDAALPHLATLLDGEAVAEALRRAAPEWGVRAGAVRFVRYRPGRQCLAAHALRLSDGREALACLRLWSTPPSAGRVRRWRRRAAPDAGLLRPGLLSLEDSGALVTAFPVDRRLPALPRLVDASGLESILRDALEAPAARLRPDGGVEVVSYKPERSCLVRCRLARRDETILLARTYRDERGAHVRSAMATLSAAPEDRRAPLARALGYCPSTRTLVQEAVPGGPLSERLDEARTLAWIAETGRALRAVHETPVSAPVRRGPAEELDWLARAARRLRAAEAALAATLGGLAERLAAHAPEPCPLATIHGDFSPGQVLVTDEGVRLIDFDRVGRGAALIDLGDGLARIEKEVADADRAAALGAELRAAYEEAAGERLPEGPLAWHHCVGLVRVALNAVTHLRPGWRDRAEDFLGRARRVLG